MSFLPASFFIIFGCFGLLYGLMFACLLLSCGKLHRLEGQEAWRVGFYCILIQAILVCLSVAASALLIYQLRFSGVQWFEATSTANTIISYASRLFEFAGFTAITLALARPFRKSASTKTSENTPSA
ncbi:hypothetical protein [Haloferula rosea]|uniref:Uncharacterized protein n=1 Tax=Haloferula rosea TaxID=490093 RepID=A0A934RBW5_9BACT|nr:hypothetical protein [Haloferula rosea]MBK1828247.1 hypothetical protein [Haloferula rosea]